MTTPPDYVFETLAEDAIVLRFGNQIDEELNRRVQAASELLRRHSPTLECAPAYASLLLRFDPLVWLDVEASDPYARLRAAVATTLAKNNLEQAPPREHVITVCYGGTFGPDLDDVATHCGLTTDDVVTRHAAGTYRVAMLGFAPGFPYLLGLDPALATPRHRDPRQRVPLGSVGIGGEQTGIYPGELPGGWRLIGRTPQRLFDAHAAQPSLLLPGDRLRFRAVDEATFSQLLTERAR